MGLDALAGARFLRGSIPPTGTPLNHHEIKSSLRITSEVHDSDLYVRAALALGTAEDQECLICHPFQHSQVASNFLPRQVMMERTTPPVRRNE
jgi:hypothetical protein